jgi:hypothetical protein
MILIVVFLDGIISKLLTLVCHHPSVPWLLVDGPEEEHL